MLNTASHLCQTRFATIIAALILSMTLHGGAAAADAVQARKDITAMGLEYNGQNFAKAAGNGDLVAVQLFLDAGMDVNEGGGAAIGLAAGRGKTAMVKFLLTKGAKPTSSALQYARTRGYKDIEKILADAGAKE
ncbi:MAG TPA: ankyrin repeat domain-containing protein [Rhodoferax sp.]|nr:ankyrin repeat domain-containing protein [Rhodoferax sp.]